MDKDKNVKVKFGNNEIRKILADSCRGESKDKVIRVDRL